MKAMHWLIILLLVVGSLLSACGQKGDLYMPDKETQQEQEEKKKQ